MPTYEYECEKTGRRFERFQSMSARPLQKCPECGGKAHRLIGTGSAVIVKGHGSGASGSAPAAVEEPRCGRSQTCCGREVPCETRPCD